MLASSARDSKGNWTPVPRMDRMELWTAGTRFLLHRIKTVLKGGVKGIAKIWSERRDSIDNLNIDKKLLFRGSPLPNAARVSLFSQRALKSPSSIRTRTRL